MLNDFGKIAIAEIVCYVPVICISFFVTLRYGFSKDEGWISLFLFSNIRVLSAVLSIVSQTQSNPPSGFLTAVEILQALALSPLLLATLGFVTNIADYGLPYLPRIPYVIRPVIVIGGVLEIIGGAKVSPTSSPSSQASGHTLLKVGSVCFLAGYCALFAIHILLWTTKDTIPSNHRKLLRSLSFALPFLAVRVLYFVLDAFVPSPSQWSSTAGNWKIYIAMALMMEYVVVSIYVITGAIIPLHKVEKEKHNIALTSVDSGLVEMGNKRDNSSER